jgi:hypothetical protein
MLTVEKAGDNMLQEAVLKGDLIAIRRHGACQPMAMETFHVTQAQ